MKTRIFLSIAVFTACFAMVSATAQQGKMYRYTDENGTVVFTENPPEDRTVQPQDIPKSPPAQSDNPYAQAGQDDTVSTAQEKREEIARSRKEAREKQERKEAQCAAWRAEVENLEPHRRHFYTNEQGETVRMDDVERVNHVAELKEKIAADCG